MLISTKAEELVLVEFLKHTLCDVTLKTTTHQSSIFSFLLLGKDFDWYMWHTALHHLIKYMFKQTWDEDKMIWHNYCRGNKRHPPLSCPYSIVDVGDVIPVSAAPQNEVLHLQYCSLFGLHPPRLCLGPVQHDCK